MKEEAQEAARMDAVFPCVLRILPTAVFNKKDPIILGVDILEGIAKVSIQWRAAFAAVLQDKQLARPLAQQPSGRCCCSSTACWFALGICMAADDWLTGS